MVKENQVCSLKLAKKLKELGVKQESLFYWVKGEMDYGYEGEWHINVNENSSWFIFSEELNCEFVEYNFVIDTGEWGEGDEDFIKWENRQKKAKNKILKNNIISAFTVAELGEMLPNNVSCEKGSKEWHISDWWGDRNKLRIKNTEYYVTSDITEANARAKMLIYLLENNLIKL